MNTSLVALGIQVQDQIKHQQTHPAKTVKEKEFQDGFVYAMVLVKAMITKLEPFSQTNTAEVEK